MAVKTLTKATVCIVESLKFLEEDSHREGEIIFRTLRLSGKRSHYTYIRHRTEFEAFATEFGESNHRYLHISCHGNSKAFFTAADEIPAHEFAGMLAPHVRNRRVFLSTCLAAESKFAHELLTRSSCLSVLAPVGTINFDDAAIFWTAFYHLIFKESPNSMSRPIIQKTAISCAKLVGQKFRLFFKDNDKIKACTLG